MNEVMGIYDRLEDENVISIVYGHLRFQYFLAPLYVDCGPHISSQAEALWESKSQIAGLACQDIRYNGPVYQIARLN
jgi:hypothetical protein